MFGGKEEKRRRPNYLITAFRCEARDEFELNRMAAISLYELIQRCMYDLETNLRIKAYEGD